MSISSANNNFLIEHLNVADKLNFYDVDMVPLLSKRAAIATIPFYLAVIVLSLIVIRQSKKKKAINLSKASD